MSNYTPTIGLEIHAELNTQTKMFCNSKNDSDETTPNVNVCPVCMGHPGTLPVINKAAVKHILRVGLALGGDLADFTEFDRKNYFYPDIPKGYQISQYKYPLVKGGVLNGVKITRVHLEEDTARSTHDQGDHSLVDFNRAGVPLMELVTEPVIHSAEEATSFARELRLLLRYLDVSDANMEKGQMRVEANISVSNEEGKLGIKVEVKNLNSFRSVERAIEFEVKRHIDLLEKGEKIVQETRGWDEQKEKTFSQRLKEESHDYRYFPDPDLPKLKISSVPDFEKEVLKTSLPELPWMKRERYSKELKLGSEAIDTLVNDENLGAFFDQVERVLSGNVEALKLASNYITSDLAGLYKVQADLVEPRKLDAAMFTKLIQMIIEGKVSSRGAKDTLALWVKEQGDPESIAKRENFLQVSDESAVITIVEQVIEANPRVVEEFKAGKEVSLQFLVGQGMKLSKGAANPQMLQKLFREKIV